MGRWRFRLCHPLSPNYPSSPLICSPIVGRCAKSSNACVFILALQMLDFWFTSYIFTGLFPLKKQVSGWRHEDCRRMCLASDSWILPVLAVAFVDLLAIWWLIKQLQLREPCASVIELGTRQELRFFRFVPTDRRVPLVVKLIPFPVAAYLANPIDLIRIMPA